MKSQTRHINRDTISLESARIESHRQFPGDQHHLRLYAPKVAANARPGSFVHLQAGPWLPMRRPVSLMRVIAEQGWIDLLYKVVGKGTEMLARRAVGETINVLGPIGTGFTFSDERPSLLLLGGGVGIPPMVFIADHARQQRPAYPVVTFMGSEIPFPFEYMTTEEHLPGVSAEINAVMPLLDGWQIPSRLASNSGLTGCFHGFVTDLAAEYLKAIEAWQRELTAVYACGPAPMLRAAVRMCAQFGLPIQVSLEEHMACGVGGCAGCTVPVQEAAGIAMRRVCVDGPVFDGHCVVFDI